VTGLPRDTSSDDLESLFAIFGELAMVDLSHLEAQGFAFLFFATAEAAMRCLGHPEQAIRGKVVSVRHKNHVAGLAVELAAAEARVFS